MAQGYAPTLTLSGDASKQTIDLSVYYAASSCYYGARIYIWYKAGNGSWTYYGYLSKAQGEAVNETITFESVAKGTEYTFRAMVVYSTDNATFYSVSYGTTYYYYNAGSGWVKDKPTAALYNQVWGISTDTSITLSNGSVWVYTSSGWKLATPWIYTSSGWKEATAYIYTSSGWKEGTG